MDELGPPPIPDDGATTDAAYHRIMAEALALAIGVGWPHPSQSFPGRGPPTHAGLYKREFYAWIWRLVRDDFDVRDGYH